MGTKNLFQTLLWQKSGKSRSDQEIIKTLRKVWEIQTTGDSLHLGRYLLAKKTGQKNPLAGKRN